MLAQNRASRTPPTPGLDEKGGTGMGIRIGKGTEGEGMASDICSDTFGTLASLNTVDHGSVDCLSTVYFLIGCIGRGIPIGPCAAHPWGTQAAEWFLQDFHPSAMRSTSKWGARGAGLLIGF